MIKRELAIFLVVGASAVLIDLIVYRGLIGYLVIQVDMAKATGFLVGTLFAYLANRFFTFGHKSHVQGSAWRFSALYASTLCANILINAFALTLLADLDGAILLAFMLATGVSASINFLGMKFFVFKQSQTLERQ